MIQHLNILSECIYWLWDFLYDFRPSLYPIEINQSLLSIIYELAASHWLRGRQNWAMLNPTMAARRTWTPARLSHARLLQPLGRQAGQSRPRSTSIRPRGCHKSYFFCDYPGLPAVAPGAPAVSGHTRRVTNTTSISPASVTPPHHPSHPPQLVAVAPSLPPSALRAAAPLRTGLGFITARTILPILPRAASLRYSSSSSTPPLSRNLSFITSKPSRRLFSSSSVDMAGIKIDGNAIAKEIREKLHAQIDEQLKTNPRFHPSLKIIQGM